MTKIQERKPPNVVININKLETELYQRGDQYESMDAGISQLLGLTQLGAAYSELPPGKSGCPFHVHHVEDEMFIILAGNGEYRFGTDVYPVSSGDILGAPRGDASFAHKLTNTGDIPLKYLSISSKASLEVCEYPDSGKFQVISKAFRFIGKPEDSRDYWEGEEGS